MLLVNVNASSAAPSLRSPGRSSKTLRTTVDVVADAGAGGGFNADPAEAPACDCASEVQS